MTKPPEPPAATPAPSGGPAPSGAAAPAATTATQPAVTAPAKPAARPPAPAKPKAPKSSNGVAGGAFVVAVCALLVAIGAIAVSVYSLKVARDALSKNAERDPAAVATTPSDVVNTTAPGAAAPSVTTSTSGPRVQYFPEFVRVEVKLPAPTGCNAVYVDVDTMAVGNSAGHEFYLTACVDPLAFRVDRTSGASSSSANPSPEVCGSLLAGTSPSQELVLQAKTPLTFCLLTNRSDATAQNLPQRLAIVELRDIGVDKSATIAVSTFRVTAT
jgi:hypothetical protein